MRRWVHEVDWEWKRPKLTAKDDDPRCVERLARIRLTFAQLKRDEAMVFADELDIHLWPKVGCAWMPQGAQLVVMTPGQHQQHDLAGALDLATRTLHHCLGSCQPNALFRDLLARLDACYPTDRYTRLYVVVDHDTSHDAKAVDQWLAAHPRFTLLGLPTFCPRANPIEHAFGDVHDPCTRNHTRRRLRDLVADVEVHLQVNGPWLYKLSDLSYEPAVTAAVENIAVEQHEKLAE
jgi:DDE superfamily endonuclease